jgi:hypothetical protein
VHVLLQLPRLLRPLRLPKGSTKASLAQSKEQESSSTTQCTEGV